MRNNNEDILEVLVKLEGIRAGVLARQKVFHEVISGLVAIGQEHRIAKNFLVSDQIRKLLMDNGIEIINGTKRYGSYENIPLSMRNNQVNDTWKYRDQNRT